MSTKAVTLRVSPELHRRLKVHALVSDKTINAIITEALENTLPKVAQVLQQPA